MSKRVLSYVLIMVFALLLIQNIGYAQISFPDMQQSHWAYASVMTLVGDGTVKGFEDGEYKPNNTVSRAEFVKMIGKGETKRQSEFSDVTGSHWGYEYIMFSGLEGADNSFRPDAAITRKDVINLIWKRNGSEKNITAPSIVASQGAEYKDAAAWGYIYGIMAGDDGINLRLDDTLTRAEAAVLIIRARAVNKSTAKKDFIGTANPKAFEVIFNAINLFDSVQYDENMTITNGEMARAAVRLGSEEFDLSYRGYDTITAFEHKYAKDLYIIGNSCIGAEKVNADFIDKPATVQDTLAALTYNIIRKSHMGVYYGNTGNYYKDIQKTQSNMADICLTFAYENGIQLYADGTINPDKAITLKEFACILLQLDGLIGSQYAVTTDMEGDSPYTYDTKISKDLSRYPANSADFQLIAEGLPNEVYEVPFADNTLGNRPIETFNFSREYGFIFSNMLIELKNKCQTGKDVNIRFTYYPSLVCKNNNGATLRVKCEILDNKDNLSLKEIFGTYLSADVPDNAKLFYADIITGAALTDIYIPSANAVIKQIVLVE